MKIFNTTKGHLVPSKKQSHVWNATLLINNTISVRMINRNQ